MKLSLPISTCLVAFPLAVSSWSVGRPSIFISPSGRMMLDSTRTSCTTPVEDMLMRRRQARFQKAMSPRISPRYEVVDNDTLLSISVDVPGVKPEDISVALEEDGKVLSIKGCREKKIGDETGFATTTSQFSQSFTLDPTVDLDQFSAQLDNGVLVVTAPKDIQRIEKNIRRIPITQSAVSEATSNSEINVEDSEQVVESAPLEESADVEADAKESDESKQKDDSE